MKPEIYARVTTDIFNALEAGVKPWRQPWSPKHAAGRKLDQSTNPIQRIAHVEEFISATGAEIRHGGAKAFYSGDIVGMPPFEYFRDAESYYSVLIRQLTHWTRHPLRLNRFIGSNPRGKIGRALEELIGEFGAAFVLAELGIEPQVRKEHTAYMQKWFEVLMKEKYTIFMAASHAQHAADFLLGRHYEALGRQTPP